MKIAVCVRQGLDGELNPFDACAYEAALCMEGAQVTLLSMGPMRTESFLLSLTRLGAKDAILLSDAAFAGADTLATAYALSLAIQKLQPDLVLCGRQTLVGDTAQTGPMLSVLAGYGLITNVMHIDSVGDTVVCTTREEGVAKVALPAVLTVERINSLRLPRLRSKPTSVTVWNAADIGADLSRCGLNGSPTRVVKTFENQSGKRKCRYITKEQLQDAIAEGLRANREKAIDTQNGDQRLERVCIVTQAPREFAQTISDDITVLPLTDAAELSDRIRELRPRAVLWGSDTASKRIAAQVAARLQVGLCADCTLLETDGNELLMYRPALSGSVIACIKSHTLPAMATVRTTDYGMKDVIVGIGYGAKDCYAQLETFAKEIGADVAASRKLVDNGIAPYAQQVGLTGKTVSPPVYIAVGISGVVHHIAGMQRAGVVIAINPDKDAPIFDYADFGIVDTAESLLK